MKLIAFAFATAAYLAGPKSVAAQGKVTRECNLIEDGQFEGHPDFLGRNGPQAAPLRGNVACVDLEPLMGRPTNDSEPGGRPGSRDANNIYGPMEAGFSSRQWECLGDRLIPGGIDTLLAEKMLEHMCGGPQSRNILDYCGGHASPYHYHERMSCLFETDEQTGHSTRLGTALDGNGMYGTFVNGGVLPTDLDVCHGRTGVTPDSNGEEVYYYMVTEEAPFSIGCYGPIDTVRECRDLYPECGNGDRYNVTTDWGTDLYDLDCPCFDNDGCNLGPANCDGRPAYMDPCLGGSLTNCLAKCADDTCTATCASTCTHPMHLDDSPKNYETLSRDLRNLGATNMELGRL